MSDHFGSLRTKGLKMTTKANGVEIVFNIKQQLQTRKKLNKRYRPAHLEKKIPPAMDLKEIFF